MSRPEANHAVAINLNNSTAKQVYEERVFDNFIRS